MSPLQPLPLPLPLPLLPPLRHGRLPLARRALPVRQHLTPRQHVGHQARVVRLDDQVGAGRGERLAICGSVGLWNVTDLSESTAGAEA